MSNKMNSNEIFNDGKYKIVRFNDDAVDHRKITCNTDTVCVLPFDTKNGNISSVYLQRLTDYLNNDEFKSCINVDTKYNDNSEFSGVSKIISDKLGLTNIDVEDLFFIGKVKHNVPFSKSYRCYAINLDNYISNINEADLESNNIEKVKFNTVVNSGELHDSICLSCSLLLLSYLQ